MAAGISGDVTVDSDNIDNSKERKENSFELEVLFLFRFVFHVFFKFNSKNSKQVRK